MTTQYSDNKINQIMPLLSPADKAINAELLLDIKDMNKRPSLLIPVIPVDQDQPAAKVPLDAMAALSVAKALNGPTTIYIADTVQHGNLSQNDIRDAGRRLAKEYREVTGDLGLGHVHVVKSSDLSATHANALKQAEKRMAAIKAHDPLSGGTADDQANMIRMAADLSYLKPLHGLALEMQAPITNGLSGMPLPPRASAAMHDFRAATFGMNGGIITMKPGTRVAPHGIQEANLMAMPAGDTKRVALDDPRDHDALMRKLDNNYVAPGYLTNDIHAADRAKQASVNRVVTHLGTLASIANRVFAPGQAAMIHAADHEKQIGLLREITRPQPQAQHLAA